MPSRGLLSRFACLSVLLAAACTGCNAGSCTVSGDCASGQVCAGPEQGPFRCYKDCEKASCPGDATCMSLKQADCLACNMFTMACFPNFAMVP